MRRAADRCAMVLVQTLPTNGRGDRSPRMPLWQLWEVARMLRAFLWTILVVLVDVGGRPSCCGSSRCGASRCGALRYGTLRCGRGWDRATLSPMQRQRSAQVGTPFRRAGILRRSWMSYGRCLDGMADPLPPLAKSSRHCTRRCRGRLRPADARGDNGHQFDGDHFDGHAVDVAVRGAGLRWVRTESGRTVWRPMPVLHRRKRVAFREPTTGVSVSNHGCAFPSGSRWFRHRPREVRTPRTVRRSLTKFQNQRSLIRLNSSQPLIGLAPLRLRYRQGDRRGPSPSYLATRCIRQSCRLLVRPSAQHSRLLPSSFSIDCVDGTRNQRRQ